VTLRARLFTGSGRRDTEIVVERPAIEGLADDELLWIDADGRTSDDLAALGDALDLTDAVATHLTEGHDPGVLRSPDHLLLALSTLESDGERPAPGRLDVLLGRNLVVTVHDDRIASLEAVDRALGHESSVGELDAGSFMTLLIDEILAGFRRETDSIERAVDELDDVALRVRSGDRFVRAVVALRDRIATIRRALVPNREALYPLVRPDMALHEDLGRAWPGIVDRLERTIDGVETARGSLMGAHDIYLSGAAQRSNEVMKVLTLVSAILLPSVVLAGIMGMNFDVAFFEDPTNFLVVIAAMAAMAVVVLVVARLRGWI
jgi:magnesium transporter